MRLRLAAAILLLGAATACATPECEARIPDAARRLGPEWIGSPGGYSHSNLAALNFQCNGAAPLTSYIQLPVNNTDISPAHADIARVASQLLAEDVPEKLVRACILKVKKTKEDDIWLAVGKFGRAFECGKDDDSHYFRIVVPGSP